VLLYSKRHFTPGLDSDLNGSSAGVISREVYESLLRVPNLELFYFDAFNTTEWLDINPDVLVSIVDAFDLAFWYFKPKISILIAVNQHPLDRLLTTSEIPTNNLPINALSGADGWLQSARKLDKASAIVYVGNQRTAESLQKYLPNSNLFQAYYLPHFEVCNSRQSAKTPKNVLVLMSSIGFRKGFDRFYSAVQKEGNALSAYNFHLVGFPEGNYWANKVSELTARYPNIQFHGWVSNLSPEFKQILDCAEYAIFPTREEGMLGSLLECMENRIICFHTKDSGIDISTEYLRIPNKGDLKLAQLLNEIDSMDMTEKFLLLEKQSLTWKNQISNSQKIGPAVVSAIEKAISSSSINQRHGFISISSTLNVYKSVPLGILLRRLKFIFVIAIQNRIYLKHTYLYSILIKFKKLRS
jgi:hypothetical protein